MSTPTAAMVVIGNENLSGRTPDANVNHLARRLSDMGIQLTEVRMVRDVESEIVIAVNALRQANTYVFTTGGIGPTHDDITAKSVARAFGVELYKNKDVVENLTRVIGPEKVTEATFKMALFPLGAELIDNPVSAAPGFRMENVYVMAGIPKIMQAMLDAVLPSLKRGEEIYSKSVDIYAGESRISEGFETIQNRYPRIELGSYPFRHGDKHGTSLVVRGTDKGQVEEAFSDIHHLIDEIGAVIRE